MINILFEPLPTAVEIDGQDVPINTDFRACLRVILAFEDPELAPVEQQAILLANLYPKAPDNAVGAFEQALRFLNGGEEHTEDDGPALRLYSFRQDANYIFAAFRQTHGIDLESIEYLHWWKFLALFMDLGSDTTFCSLVSLRKHEEMHDVLDIEEPLSADEREQEAEFMRLIKEGQHGKA